jgi:hypothetical protein
VGSSIDKVYMVMEYLENDLKSCMDMSASPFSMAEVSAPSSTHPSTIVHCRLIGAFVLGSPPTGEATNATALERRGPHAQTLVHPPGPEDLQSTLQQ